MVASPTPRSSYEAIIVLFGIGEARGGFDYFPFPAVHRVFGFGEDI